MSETSRCPLCDASRPRPVAAGCDGGPLSQCPVCRLVFRDPQPDDASLGALYASLYFPGSGPRSYGMSAESLMAALVDRLEAAVGPVADRHVLDFGCGTGPLLRALAARGARATGVEYDDRARAEAPAVPVFKSLQELRRRRAVPEGGFDLCCAVEVVEHLRRPWETLAELRGLLRSGAPFYCSTPNVLGLKARLARGTWSEARNPTHLYLFSEATLLLALERAGFRTVQMHRWGVDFPGHGRLRAAGQRVLVPTGLGGSVRALAW